MGAIAEAIVEYAQPLLDATDGSPEQMDNAFSMAQVFWNLALLPEGDREKELAHVYSTLGMDDNELDEFRRSVVVPMIRRHHEMFPNLPGFGATGRPPQAASPRTHPATSSPSKKQPGTGRNAPCPCNSGKKFKKCCGR